jgi:hypothetical protein
MIAIEKHEIKVRKEQEKANEENQNFLRDQEMQEDTIEQEVRTPCRSSYSIGLGKLLASIRASTNGDTIRGPLASYALLGNDIFALSHKTVPLPLMQAIAYLEKKNIYATITRFGEVKASIHDYVFRATQANKIDTMNFWNFTRTKESRVNYLQKKAIKTATKRTTNQNKQLVVRFISFLQVIHNTKLKDTVIEQIFIGQNI